MSHPTLTTFDSRVVLQPSTETDFVVLGDNVGPSKLAAIEKHELNTLNEGEFLNLITTRKGLGNGKVDEKMRKKGEKKHDDIEKDAEGMKKREQKEKVAAEAGKLVDPNTQLWTVRYAPQNVKEVCGNKDQVEKLQKWLHDWYIVVFFF